MTRVVVMAEMPGRRANSTGGIRRWTWLPGAGRVAENSLARKLGIA